MKKRLLTLFLIIIALSSSVAITAHQLSKNNLFLSGSVIDGDTIIGRQKDIDRFQEAEQFVIDWFADRGYSLSYDVTIEFTTDVGIKMREDYKKEFDENTGGKLKLGGLFQDGVIYVVDYRTFLLGNNSKFDIKELDVVQKGIIIHELAHCYLYKYGISTFTNTAVQEFIASILEIESYPDEYKTMVLYKAAALIARHKYNAPNYIMKASNYHKNTERFQILAYWVYKSRDGEILVESIMSLPY